MARLIVALRELGYTINEIEWHHEPPLALRRWDARRKDYDPPSNDPDSIRILTKGQHKTQTHGPGGEKRITTAGGDLHAIRKANRLAEKTDEFRRRILKRKPSPKRTRKPWGRKSK